MKPQFGSPQNRQPRETHRGTAAVRRRNSVAQIFQPLFPPRLLPQELRRYDPQDVTLRLFVPGKLACPALHRLPEDLLFPPRSPKYLLRSHRTRCAPNLGEWLIQSRNTRGCNAWRVPLNPTPSVPPQLDYAQGKRETLPNLVPGLMRSYHLALLLVRSFPPWSLGKKLSFHDATR